MADTGLRQTLEEARQYLKAFEDALAAFSQHEEVVIWLSHTLSNQLILIKVLDWFSRRDLGAVKLSLICIASCPGMDRFVGLGQLQTQTNRYRWPTRGFQSMERSIAPPERPGIRRRPVRWARRTRFSGLGIHIRGAGVN